MDRPKVIASTEEKASESMHYWTPEKIRERLFTYAEIFYLVLLVSDMTKNL